MRTPDVPIKSVVIDAAPHNAELLNHLLLNFNQIENMALASTISDGIEAINAIKPDIIFLDIEIDGEGGFNILNLMGKIVPGVIFTAAHEFYALNADKFSMLDYLLKPFCITEVSRAIHKYETEKSLSIPEAPVSTNQILHNTIQDKKIGLQVHEGILFINIADIIYCKADGNYTLFILVTGEKIVVSNTLKKYEEMLSGFSFFRVHNSHLINLNYLKKYISTGGGAVVMQNDHEISISRRRKETFLSMLKLCQLM